MKKMTCRELGGACDIEFQANTFEEMAELVKAHGMEMYMAQDRAHIEAMSKVQDLMQAPGDMEAWYDNKRKEFDALSDI